MATIVKNENGKLSMDGKFITVLAPSNAITVNAVKYGTGKYGTTYKIEFSVSGFPSLNGKRFLIRSNTKQRTEYATTYDHVPSDCFGMLAEFFSIKKREILSIIKNESMANAASYIQSLFERQNSRIMKIDSTVIPQSTSKVSIFGVKYEDNDIRVDLKKIGCQWSPNEKCWTGNLTKTELSDLSQKYYGRQINFSNVSEFDDVAVKMAEYRVFNIATEEHVTITFSEIRNIVVKKIGKEIVLCTNNEDALTQSNSDKIIEYVQKGRPVWEYNLLSTSITAENGTVEHFKGKIIIESGDNVKTAGIAVLALIKIGSCDNSARVAAETVVYHRGNYREKIIAGIEKAMAVIVAAMDIIKIAMNTHITLEKAKEMVACESFGLKDPEKIEKVRDLVTQRLIFEYDKNQTVWSLSQSLTFVGTHAEQYQNDFVNGNIGNSVFSRLQETGYNVIGKYLPSTSS